MFLVASQTANCQLLPALSTLHLQLLGKVPTHDDKYTLLPSKTIPDADSSLLTLP